VSERAYPDRPYIAVSAAIFRQGQVLVVRRAQPPGQDLFSFPGGVVEAGETLAEAVIREVAEETGLTIDLAGLAGYREVIFRDVDQRVERHFVILAFAARWSAGEFRSGAELTEGRWVRPTDLANLPTTEGLADIVTAAAKLIATEE
jgi:ADP-ribose pyrophosphatase YjhB (NUDIX family)